jgi:hypothetical protein
VSANEFAETAALVAVIEGNTGRLAELLAGMYRSELFDLASQCDELSNVARHALRERSDA